MSDFLTVEEGLCLCVQNQPNMVRADSGACSCNSGYHMSETGCLACDYLVPLCTECSEVTEDTLIPLYMDASFTTT